MRGFEIKSFRFQGFGAEILCKIVLDHQNVIIEKQGFRKIVFWMPVCY